MRMRNLIAVGLAVLMSSTAIGGVVAQPINDNQLSDPRVRQAIAYAIDMDTIAETIFEGAAVPAIGLLPDGPNKPTDLNPYGGAFGGWIMSQMALGAASLASRHSKGRAILVAASVVHPRLTSRRERGWPR